MITHFHSSKSQSVSPCHPISVANEFYEWNVNAIEMRKRRRFPCAVNFTRIKTTRDATTRRDVARFDFRSNEYARNIYFRLNNQCAILESAYAIFTLLRKVKTKLIIDYLRLSKEIQRWTILRAVSRCFIISRD